MTLKQFLKPTLWKVLLTLMIPIFFGLFFSYYMSGSDSASYSWYAPLPLIKEGCGLWAPLAEKCDTGFMVGNLFLDSAIVVAWYFCVSVFFYVTPKRQE